MDANGAVTQAYEDLRSSYLEGAGSMRGRALLMRRGLAAWIQAWVASSPRPPADTRRPRVVRPAVDRGCEEELIHLLTTMTLSNFQEAIA